MAGFQVRTGALPMLCEGRLTVTTRDLLKAFRKFVNQVVRTFSRENYAQHFARQARAPVLSCIGFCPPVALCGMSPKWQPERVRESDRLL
eukprot:11139694-Alexandrium_andersonii.AAC.1